MSTSHIDVLAIPIYAYTLSMFGVRVDERGSSPDPLGLAMTVLSLTITEKLNAFGLSKISVFFYGSGPSLVDFCFRTKSISHTTAVK
jgi:hypothetical protein